VNKFICQSCKKKITYLITHTQTSDIIYSENYVEPSDERSPYCDNIENLESSCPKCGNKFFIDEVCYEDANAWVSALENVINCKYTGFIEFNLDEDNSIKVQYNEGKIIKKE